MKFLQIQVFRKLPTHGFGLRRKIRVLKTRKPLRKWALANTRILDAPTHGHGQPPAHGARSLIASHRVARCSCFHAEADVLLRMESGRAAQR
jgi:hypothetical protein